VNREEIPIGAKIRFYLTVFGKRNEWVMSTTYWMEDNGVKGVHGSPFRSRRRLLTELPLPGSPTFPVAVAGSECAAKVESCKDSLQYPIPVSSLTVVKGLQGFFTVAGSGEAPSAGRCFLY
jgi:hypothetical protein